MGKSWLMCVLLGSLAWGQAAPSQTPAPAPGPPGATHRPQPPAEPETAASVPADAPVITVKGVCPAQPKPAASKTAGSAAASKPASADCKTVITKAEFERLASGVSPNLTPQLRRQLANVLPRLIAMSAEAQKKGLDKNPRYLEMVKFAKMQILTNELQRSIQDEASKVPDTEIAEYYKKNPEAYEQYNLDRLFIPRFKQAEVEAEGEEKEEKQDKLTEEQQKKKEEEDKAKQAQSEQELTKLADSLRARAAAGEDFLKLQKEAFDAAGMKIESPTVNLPKIRRTGLPPGHAAVFELKEGEVSQVISDSGGHYVYKVEKKEALALDQVKDEVHATLQNQRLRDMMDKYQNSFKTDTNEAYFGPAGPAQPPRGAGIPPRAMPAPSQVAPATPPSAPAPKPN